MQHYLRKMVPMSKTKRVVAEAFHPSKYILEVLESRQIKREWFYDTLEEIGISRYYMMDVLAEERPVNKVIAIGLSQYFNTTRKIWLNFQKAYDEHPTIKKGEFDDDT